MHAGHDADEKIQSNPATFLQPLINRLWSYACNADLSVRFVGEFVMHVVRQLAVDADRLELVQDSVARSFEHGWSL